MADSCAETPIVSSHFDGGTRQGSGTKNGSRKIRLPLLRQTRCERDSAARRPRDRHGLHNHVTVDHRQTIARAIVHADGVILTLVAVGDVITDEFIAAAQRDAVTGLFAHALAARRPIGIAIRHVIADHAAGL